MASKSFENVKGQIGYCGIWCGSCLGGNGAIFELTRNYEQIIKRSQSALEKYAPKEFNFNELMKNLACVQAMPQCPGCKKDGGDMNCRVRLCASKKSIDNCSKCSQLMECRNFEELEKGCPKIKEDLAKIKGADKKRSQRKVDE